MNSNIKNEERNIDFVYDNNLCHFCGTCYGVCPKDNITLGRAFNGNPVFKVKDSEKCSGCELCYHACPGHEVDFEQLHQHLFSKSYEFGLLGSYLNCFLSHSTDHDVRYHAASGGSVSITLITALETHQIDGAIVVKMANSNNPLETKVYIARSREEILDGSGSKYITVPLNIAMRSVLQAEREEKYALVGLPCHIHGLRKAQILTPRLRRRIPLVIGLFCGRGTSPLGTELLLRNLKVKKGDVAKIAYRKGKWPGGFAVTLKTGDERFLALNDYIYIMKMFQNVRCTLCVDHTAEFADISCGDAWLPELSGQPGWNILMTRTKTGQDLLTAAIQSKSLTVHQTDPSQLTLSQRLPLYDKKHMIFAVMDLLKSLRLERTIPRYTGVKLTGKSGMHDYLRALIFFVVARVSAAKSLNSLLNPILYLPPRFLRMDFSKKRQIARENVMKLRS
ncbi:MAG: Coenzyme F420 hydrogenase/dehydrogenase, beta subunit C-terminal domain [Candidatus Hodarchaeota archaeon]